MKLPSELASHSSEKFLKTFKNLYEHSPWFVEQSLEAVALNEKYNNLEKFHEILSEIMLSSKSDMQDDLITAHPLLAGKKAQNNELTDFSTTEQKSAGLNDCTDDEIKLFEKLNEEYFSKFNFPFIMAVKEKNKSEIISTFLERKNNSRDEERTNALVEINKIAWLRIKEIYGI
jgi:OHCU decarboxylase